MLFKRVSFYLSVTGIIGVVLLLAVHQLGRRHGHY
jgi:hypothetical protein